MNIDTKIATARGNMCAFETLYHSLLTPYGYVKCPKVHKSIGSMRVVTIETYAKTITIECTEDVSAKTERGNKKIWKLKKGDTIQIKGVYVPFRYSVIKSIKFSKKRRAGIIRYNKNHICVANGMVIKF